MKTTVDKRTVMIAESKQNSEKAWSTNACTKKSPSEVMSISIVSATSGVRARV